MAYDGSSREIIFKSNAFEKEAERTRHLFKGQNPPIEELMHVGAVYATTSAAPGGIVFCSTGPDDYSWVKAVPRYK